MGLTSVVSIFATCILFNIILPTSDVGTDLDLMYKTVNFNIGDSLELDGCKFCYRKTEKDVYHPTKDRAKNHCKTCIYDPTAKCGRFSRIIRKVKQYQDEEKNCLDSNSFTYKTFPDRSKSTFVNEKCEEIYEDCCAMKTKTKRVNPIQKLDPRKLFWPCLPIRYLHTQYVNFNLTIRSDDFDYCSVSGQESYTYCSGFKPLQFIEQLQKVTILVVNSPSKETVFFYPFSLINQTWTIQEKNHSITDPKITCGILFFRHNNEYDHQRAETDLKNYVYYCNEDVCLIHLKALHRDTSITNLTEWRKKTEYLAGRKVGGFTCHLLQIYGWSILIPFILNLIFSIVLFIDDFQDGKAKQFEILMIIFAFYTQYKTLKLLMNYLFIHHDEDVLRQDKDANDKIVANREPFLESCFQVNISMAILFATEGFFPKQVDGQIINTTYKDPNFVLPLLSFCVSMFSSSFGMSQFFMNGPIQFLQNDSALNGLLSLPFLSLCLINSMFGFRIICIENAFFTSYNYQIWSVNKYGSGFEHKQISPIIPPEYRLVVYLAPCIIPFMINISKLMFTTKGLWKYLMKYPQFLISPCFTPFIFESNESAEQQGQCKLKIWKWGSIINAIYIGCLPQCILCFTDYYKGVHQWEFNKNIDEGSMVHSSWRNDGFFTATGEDYENNNSLFKSNYGNTIFGATTATFFLILIVLFFGSGTLFKERGIHCRIFSILFCPCPNDCINVDSIDLDPPSSQNSSDLNNIGQIPEEGPSTPFDKPKTEVYWYYRRGEIKIKLLGSLRDEKHFKSQIPSKMSERSTETNRKQRNFSNIIQCNEVSGVPKNVQAENKIELDTIETPSYKKNVDC